MPWLYLHPKSKRWFIGWRVGKKVFNRSTGCTKEQKAEAEKQLATVNIMSSAASGGKLTEAVYLSLTGQEVQRIALMAAVEDYLTRKTGTVSKGTLASYKSVLNALLAGHNATKDKPDLADVTTGVLQKYLSQKRKQCSAVACNNAVTVLGLFFRDADKKYHTGDPTKALDRYYETPEEADAPDRRPFTLGELKLIHGVAPNGFWKFAIKCAFYTGFRLGRIATLQWQHINFESRVFDVKDVKPQVKKKVAVPIMDDLYRDLKAVKAAATKSAPSDFLWPDQAELYRKRGAAPLSVEFHDLVLVPAKLAGEYNRDADKTSKLRKTNALTFHSLKHNLVTGMKGIGAPEMVVREMVGHDSAAVSAIYTHSTPEMARAHMEKIISPFDAKLDSEQH